ncbi:MAG TPA: amidohydrolase family protein [Amycolatopsis sp.]|uniref:amidohydrolase family protein n=1 Tax=Amycolatopsis sp. TaxID=37632 RepID=UPI002F3EF9C4
MATTITGVRVFDGERLTEHTAVRLEGGLIDAVGGDELLRPGDQHVAGRGTLLPGLIDAHVHLLPGASRQALTFGVTTLLDMFSKPETVREAEAEGGADVRSSSIGATAPGGHPSMMYAPFPYVTGPADAEAFVADRVAEGARHLKVLYDDGGPLRVPSLDVPTVAALVSAAHGAGLLAVAHVTTAAAAVDLLPTGVDVLAHVPFDPLTATQVAAIGEAGVAVIATLSIADGFPGDVLLEAPELAGRLGPAWSDVLRRQAHRWLPPELPDFAAAARNVGLLYEAGVTVLAGTDAPNPGIVHGASVHRELQRLVAAGLTPVEALAAATARTAEVFGLADRGRVLPGLRADLLLVDGSPDVDVAETQRIAAVWKDGVRADVDGYVGSAAERAGLEALRAQTEKVIAAVREMLPVTVRRDEDGEVLGHLRREGTGWQPVTVFGGVLAGPSSREEAEEVLRRDGLASLGEVWWVHSGAEFREARIQEARPDRIRIRWADPLVEQSPQGEWIDPRVVRIQRQRPEAE